MASPPFDLEKALGAWRRLHAHRRAFLREDLDELEQHVRDHVAHLLARGLPEEAAFRRAVEAVGDLDGGEAEYGKVYWGKLRRHHQRLNELAWRLSMLQNYVLVALRNLRRNKGYTFLNVGGLAVGLSCFVLILLFVQHERSYDRFHPQAERIYRLVQQRPTSTGGDVWAVTSPALAGTLAKAFPEVQVATTVGRADNPLLSVGDQHYQEEGLLADTSFFDVFSFALVRGEAETALAAPNSLVLTEALARKLFGDGDPMGRTVRYQNQDVYTVTAVLADVPETSHLRFTYLLPVQSNPFYASGVTRSPLFNNGWYTYTLLAPGTDVARLEGKMRAFVDENLPDWRPEDRMTFRFQPLLDIHLRSQAMVAFETGGDLRYVYLFLAIAFAILLLACVNYTNLAIARSARRAREVGMRKVVGAGRGQLVGQFLGESVLMAALALVLALGLVHLLLPVFGGLVERPIRMDYAGNGLLVPGLVALVLLVGVLSGSYPALFMAALRPLQVLSGKGAARTTRFRVQRVLVVGQYAVSVALVAGSLVVYEQMRHVQRQDLGYDRAHVVAVRASDEALSRAYDTLREAWLRDPRVVAVSYSKFLPTNVGNKQSMFGWEGSSEGELLPTSTTSVDYDFLDVYGIALAAGRGFSRAFATDTVGAALINETTARALGWTPEEAVGKRFGFTDGEGERTIVGVVKDFHFNSVHQPLEPLVLTLGRYPTGYLSAKVRPDDLPGTLALLEQGVKRFSAYPFAYQFVDETFDQLYKQDARLGETFGFFTVLALLIASLGLFGLAAFTAEQRTKEVGIRKVLGASVGTLVALLSKDFLKLVLVAFVVGAPVAYVALERWLAGFAYRITLGPGVFVLSGGLALAAAFLTVGYQAVRAARANPVKSLRHE